MCDKKIDWSKPVQTREGRPVRILCTDMRDSSPVVGLVSFPEGDILKCWRSTGVWENGCISNQDLINVPEPKKEYHVRVCILNNANMCRMPLLACITCPNEYGIIAKKDIVLKEGDGLD